MSSNRTRLENRLLRALRNRRDIAGILGDNPAPDDFVDLAQAMDALLRQQMIVRTESGYAVSERGLARLRTNDYPYIEPLHRIPKHAFSTQYQVARLPVYRDTMAHIQKTLEVLARASRDT